MILYINGDSHSVAAEAVNPAAFANDQHPHWSTPHRHGHAANLSVAYGAKLADKLNCGWINQGESGSSNDRIIRTTDIFLETSNINDLVLLIGWSTWERQEWLHSGTYYQITASGTDTVPKELTESYKKWVTTSAVDFSTNELVWHEKIWKYHLSLKQRGIKHLFFNTYSYFAHTVLNHLPRYDWGDNYVDPYNQNSTYFYWAQAQGCKTVNPNSYHYGTDAHTKWAEYLVPHLTKIL